MHGMDAVKPVHANTLTREQKRRSLKMLMFIKEKRYWRLKGRRCADDKNQRKNTHRKYKTLPTVTLESVLLTAMIYSSEGRDVAVTEIPGTYLHTEMDEEFWVIFEGTLAELIVKVSPKLYSPYVTVDKRGRKVLYAKISKALYGFLRSALLFYRKLRSDLVKMGFVVNPYDPCVANNYVRGKQLNICWHVDELKISHVNKKFVTSKIKYLEKIYGKMRTSRGTRHD